MRNTIIRYSSYSVITLLLLLGLNYLLAGKNINYTAQEIIGYITIFLSMIFVFAGIKHYRDKINGGAIKYFQALKLGCLVVIFPAIAFGIFNVIYVKYLDNGIMEKYYNDSLLKMRSTMSAADFMAKSKVMEQQKAMMENLFLQFIVMFLTVFVIGIAVSAVSALILQKRPNR